MLRPPKRSSAPAPRPRAELDLAPPPLLDRPRHRHRSLPLGGLDPLLYAYQVGGHPLGDEAGVPRPVLRLDRDAILGQRDQLGFRTAAVQPGQSVGRLAPHRPADHLCGACPV